jgi:hypothetical protein
MKLVDTITSMPPLEMGLLFLFVIYIIFPMHTPASVASMVDTPLGMIVIFCVTLFLFFYTNPILGILYILVAYELIRRSSKTGGLNVNDIGNGSATTSIIQYTRTQAQKDAEMKAMNPPQSRTLEEEVIQNRAPIPHVNAPAGQPSSFKPVCDKTISGASMVV